MTGLSAAVGLQVVGTELYAINALPNQMLQVFSGAASTTGNATAVRVFGGPTSMTAPRELCVY